MKNLFLLSIFLTAIGYAQPAINIVAGQAVDAGVNPPNLVFIDKFSSPANKILMTNRGNLVLTTSQITGLDSFMTTTNSNMTLKANTSDVYPLTGNPSGFLTGFSEIDPLFNTKFTAKTTSDLSEGTNLYWTNTRGDSRYPQMSGSYSDPTWLASVDWSKVTGLSTVANTGAYSDLTGTPNLSIYYLDSNPNGYISSVPAQSFSSITGKPTNLSGYGITDAYPLSGNPSNYITSSGVNNSTVLAALGATPLFSEVDGSVTNEIELPSQTSQSGKVLSTNGTTPSWLTLPSAVGTSNASGYSSGTSYTLTTSSAKVTFGTTSPSITLPSAGTYLIMANLKLEYAGLTNTAVNACNFKLRRINNTASDLANASTTFNVPVVTLLTQTGGDSDIAAIIYTTANNNDVIEMWANRGTGVTLGNIQVGEASLVAVRIY